MKAEIYVATGEVWATEKEVILKSNAIGSCIGLVAFDKNKGIGALAHIMLPGFSSDKGLIYNTKYAQDAIKDMLFKMVRLGAVVDCIEACLVGGGNVLQDKDDRICAHLIYSVSKILKEKGIPVVAENLGGIQRRSVAIDIKDGAVFCAEGDDQDKLLYKWSYNLGDADG